MAQSYRCGSAALYMRQWRTAHKALGLCNRCKAKALPGRRTCRQHVAKRLRWLAAQRTGDD